MRLVQGMYANERSHVRVGEGYREEFEVKVIVHRDTVLSLLRFIIVLEPCHASSALGSPERTSFADDLGIITESLEEECVRRLLTWKEAMEEKGLSKCRKDKDHDLCVVQAWTPCRVQANFHVQSALEWAATSSSETATSTGCTRLQRVQALGKGP